MRIICALYQKHGLDIHKRQLASHALAIVTHDEAAFMVYKAFLKTQRLLLLQIIRAIT
jgi:hypothetical protein